MCYCLVRHWVCVSVCVFVCSCIGRKTQIDSANRRSAEVFCWYLRLNRCWNVFKYPEIRRGSGMQSFDCIYFCIYKHRFHVEMHLGEKEINWEIFAWAPNRSACMESECLYLRMNSTFFFYFVLACRCGILTSSSLG